MVATANAGYVFSKWTVGGSQVSTSPSYTFTVAANKTLVANFVIAGVAKTIATSANPTAGGTTNGSGNYLTGISATLVATASPGYAFSKWQEGSTIVSTSPSYTFTVTGKNPTDRLYIVPGNNRSVGDRLGVYATYTHAR